MLTFLKQKSHKLLSSYIRGYWLIEGDQAKEILDLAPDGYPELFFVLRGSLLMPTFSGNTRWTANSGGGLIGQATSRVGFEIEPNSSILYVKLYPWTPYALFQVPSWRFNDLALELEAVASGDGFDALHQMLLDHSDHPTAFAAILDDFFLKEISPSERHNPFLQLAVRQIYNTHGAVSVEQLTDQVHASRRYTEKIFKAEIGLPPKRYAQIIRVKKASIHLLDPRFKGNISAIASSLDYYDQSHFLKDFKVVMHQTPTEFMKTRPNFSENDVIAYLDQWDYS